MRAKLAIGGVGVCVSSLFGAAAYYSSGDVHSAVVAGGVWALGAVLLALFAHKYETLDVDWERDAASRLGQLGIWAVITPIMIIDITDTITMMILVMGTGIVGYMSGVHHLASSHPAISSVD